MGGMAVRDLLIVGAGPSGLATAIAAAEAGLDYEVLEKGVLVNSVFHFPPQMTFFTSPDLLEIGGHPFVSPYEKPTRHEALRYYRRVAERHGLAVTLGETVSAVTAAPASGAQFLVTSSGAAGNLRERLAQQVVIATGYYDQPNRLGIPGESLPHVAHYYGDPHAHWRQRVVIVGGRNSAAIAALELYRAGAHVTLVHRGEALSPRIKYWIRPDIENRIREGAVQAHFGATIEAITPRTVRVRAADGQPLDLEADAVLLLTGYHPDVALLTAAGVTLGPQQVPTFHPDTMETNVPGLYLAGGLVGGLDTGAIFIENGRFHGEQIVRHIVGRRATVSRDRST